MDKDDVTLTRDRDLLNAAVTRLAKWDLTAEIAPHS